VVYFKARVENSHASELRPNSVAVRDDSLQQQLMDRLLKHYSSVTWTIVKHASKGPEDILTTSLSTLSGQCTNYSVFKMEACVFCDVANAR